MKLTERVEYEILGQVVGAAIDELGLSQRALGRRVGRTETSISKIVAGHQRLDLVELSDIAQALRLPLAEMVSRYELAVAERKQRAKPE